MEPSSYYEAVAAEVRASAARVNCTQTAISEVTGIAKATLSRKMTGKVPFDLLELAKVAKALNVSLDSLLLDKTPFQEALAS